MEQKPEPIITKYEKTNKENIPYDHNTSLIPIDYESEDDIDDEKFIIPDWANSKLLVSQLQFQETVDVEDVLRESRSCDLDEIYKSRFMWTKKERLEEKLKYKRQMGFK